jgi:hypothetical protein
MYTTIEVHGKVPERVRLTTSTGAYSAAQRRKTISCRMGRRKLTPTQTTKTVFICQLRVSSYGLWRTKNKMTNWRLPSGLRRSVPIYRRVRTSEMVTIAFAILLPSGKVPIQESFGKLTETNTGIPRSSSLTLRQPCRRASTRCHLKQASNVLSISLVAEGRRAQAVTTARKAALKTTADDDRTRKSLRSRTRPLFQETEQQACFIGLTGSKRQTNQDDPSAGKLMQSSLALHSGEEIVKKAAPLGKEARIRKEQSITQLPTE